MDEVRTTKKVSNTQPIGTRRKFRPNLRWIDGLEKDLLVLRTKNWRTLAGRRLAWKRLLENPKATPACRASEEGRNHKWTGMLQCMCQLVGSKDRTENEIKQLPKSLNWQTCLQGRVIRSSEFVRDGPTDLLSDCGTQSRKHRVKSPANEFDRPSPLNERYLPFSHPGF
ncbi:uncharacterized protein TNCV_329651 [Trichonephila clavipes]|nr:uncharacterized protein TNCV_329651 [Trichonephila clavipes]